MPLASDGKGNWLALGQDGQWTPAQRAKNPETGAELLFDGTEWKPLPDVAGAQQKAEAREANSGTGGFIDGIGRTLAQGASFGFADEIAAGGDALLGHLAGRGSQASGIGARYSENLERERARDAAFREDNPGTALAGNLVGGIAVPGAMGANLIRGGGVAASAGRGMIAGGTGGAAAGFGEAEGGLGNRLGGAAAGLGMGVAAGGALGAGVNVAGRVGGRVLDTLGMRNADLAADRQILRAFDRDGRSLADVAADAASPPGGAPLALADLGGRNTTTLAAVAANVPGASTEAADALVQARRAAGPDRMARIADDAFGGGQGEDVAAQMDALGRRRAADAAPLYNEAFSKPAGFTDQMQSVLDDPITRSGLARGLEVQRLENTARRARGEPELPMSDKGIRFDDDGTPRIVSEPNMRTMDAVKRGLDSMIEEARDGTTGKVQWTERLRAIDEIRRGWVNLLDKGNPTYAAAREAWAGPSQAMDAVNRGRQAFRADRDMVGQATERLSPGDQDFYRLGAGRAFTDMASDPAKAPGVARRMLEDRQMQARLQSLLPPDKNAVMAEALRGEMRVNAGNAAYSPRAGSQTARLQAGMEDMGADPPGGAMMALLEATQRGGLTGAAASGAQRLIRRTQGINSSTADALAQRLFQADPQRNAEIVRALTARQGKDALTAQQRAALAERLLQGLGVAGGIEAND